MRQFRQDVGRDNAIFVHLTLVPYIATAHELKTKPTQHSVRELRAIGIQPDILLCRTDRYLSPDIKAKIALFCDVPEEAVITAKDVDSIYEVPLVLSGEGLDAIVLKSLEPPSPGRDMGAWERLVDRIKNPKGEVVIGIVGQVRLLRGLLQEPERGPDPRRLRQRRPGRHGAGSRPRSSKQGNADAKLSGVDGILVPGGFGTRGTEGMIAAAEFARADRDALLRHLLRLPVGGHRVRAQRVPASRGELHRGRPRRRAQGHLQAPGPARASRSWAAPCASAPTPAPRSRGHARPRIYGATEIRERHRHRYEFNKEYERLPGRRGPGHLRARPPTGSSSRSRRSPTIPGTSRCQFHPEFKSKPLTPHPALRGLRPSQPARTVPRDDVRPRATA